MDARVIGTHLACTVIVASISREHHTVYDDVSTRVAIGRIRAELKRTLPLSAPDDALPRFARTSRKCSFFIPGHT